MKKKKIKRKRKKISYKELRKDIFIIKKAFYNLFFCYFNVDLSKQMLYGS